MSTRKVRVVVKLRRTQYEHMLSALPSNSDIARRNRHVSNVPKADIEAVDYAKRFLNGLQSTLFTDIRSEGLLNGLFHYFLFVLRYVTRIEIVRFIGEIDCEFRIRDNLATRTYVLARRQIFLRGGWVIFQHLFI